MKEFMIIFAYIMATIAVITLFWIACIYIRDAIRNAFKKYDNYFEKDYH